MPDGQKGTPQQTLSTQLPEIHCEPATHGRPVGCGVGLGVDVRVAVPVGGGGTMQMPEEPQTSPTAQALVLQQTPSVQKPDWHCAALVHAAPKPSFVVQTPGFDGRSQACPVWHDTDAQHAPSTQFPEMHCTPALH